MRSRALVAALAALGAFGLQPAAAGQAVIDPIFSAGCPIATGIPAITNQAVDLTGSLSCFRPGGAGPFGDKVAPPDAQVRVQAPAQPTLGEPCRNVFNHNVSFTEDTGGGEFATFQYVGGKALAHTLADPYTTMIGHTDFWVQEVQLGSYELSDPTDPNSPLTCLINPTYHISCPDGTLDPASVCYWSQNHPIAQANSPPPAWGPYFARAIGDIGGARGTVSSAPARTGVVNTPTCFWIDNMGIPNERDLTLTIAGPPDSSGRSIFYTFVARIAFQQVQWDFGDGDTSQATPPLACGQHPQLVAHEYTKISDDQADHRYHVTAHEIYTITMDEFYVDGFGLQGPFAVDPGVAAPILTPDTYDQFVGQVEGIPIGSP